MPSRYTENTLCPKCGAKCRIVVTNGIWPMRSQETGICPNCGAEIIRKISQERLKWNCLMKNHNESSCISSTKNNT